MHDFTTNIGEPEVATQVPVSELLVIKAEGMQDSSLQIMNVDLVFHDL